MHVCMCTTNLQCRKKLEEVIESSGTGVYSCELLCGCCEPNLGLLEEQPVILSIESSLQLLSACVLKEFFPLPYN